ncbi:hypothetical protein ANCDUO_08831 [Ancylostoma duodenale]|uniref:Paired domain-containing protein n=1 Tax=Ancylostoma duodenale TaxID=51022 RepID=A0A0C2CVK1_9BILA|nr:hypothetical protein ANCDUO_08831 [Ancylostoma duodenale]
MVEAHPKRSAILHLYTDIIKRFKKLGTTSDRPGRGRKPTVIVPSLVNKVRCRIWRNPRRSMRKMAEDIGVSASSMRRVV